MGIGTARVGPRWLARGRGDRLPSGQRAGAGRGQAVVEFALVSLLLLMLVFGLLDLGRGVFARAMLTNAVREATRYGSIHPSDTTGMVAAATSRSPSLGLSSGNFTTGGGSVSCSNDSGSIGCTSAAPGNLLRVCTAYRFGLIAPRLIRVASQ